MIRADCQQDMKSMSSFKINTVTEKITGSFILCSRNGPYYVGYYMAITELI